MKGNLDYEEAAKGIKDNCSLITSNLINWEQNPIFKDKKPSSQK